MPAQWTGDLVGKMHLFGITKKELADQVGCSREYLSSILNGHRSPKDAQQTVEAALDRLINEQCNTNAIR